MPRVNPKPPFTGNVEALSHYPNRQQLVWVQEEAENMGAWRFIYNELMVKNVLKMPMWRLSRKESASPATGSSASHKLEQKVILEKAFSESLEGSWDTGEMEVS